MAESKRAQLSFPVELLSRILRRVAIISPPSYLNCLLTCQTWNSALSAHDKQLVKYNFLNVEDLPTANVFYMDERDDSVYTPALDLSRYRIWHRLHIAHLKSEFQYLGEMQSYMLQCEDVPCTVSRRAPTNNAEWAALFADIEMLRRLSMIKTFSSESWRTDGSEGSKMICSLLMAPSKEFDNAENNDVLPFILSRSGVPRQFWPFYLIERVPLENRATAVESLLQEIGLSYSYVDPWVSEENEEWRLQWRQKAEELYTMLKDGDVIELVYVRLNGSPYSTVPGYLGNFCRLILCRRKKAGQRILGWLTYYEYIH